MTLKTEGLTTQRADTGKSKGAQGFVEMHMGLALGAGPGGL